MAHRVEESDLLIHRVSSKEAQASLSSSTPEPEGVYLLLKQVSCLPCNICVRSKAVMLIFVWSMIIGAVYLILLNSFGVAGFSIQYYSEHIKKVQTTVNLLIVTVAVAYAMLALILLVYPLSGYFADVWCGRYKAVIISLVFLCVALVLLCVTTIIAITKSWKLSDFGPDHSIPFGVLAVLSFIVTVLSLSCYQANIIQLGLDQLLEAPSDKLGLFIHWLMWSYTFGSFIPLIIFVFLPCSFNIMNLRDRWIRIVTFTPFIALLLLSLLLAFTCYNHNWFYSEPGQNNPYNTVFRVLNFARKNKYPLCRSAFTFCDDFKPSRIDFAKERYGGPFTTPQVEDVKTFLRIVMLLLSLGPIYILEVPGSYYLFPLFTLHVDSKLQFQTNHRCYSVIKWVLLQSGSLGYITSVILFPLYIWTVYSLFRKRIPKILSRLRCVVFMPLAGVACLLITDLIGHYHQQQHYQNNSTSGVCLFTSYLVNPEKNQTPTLLNMHWSVNIPPCILSNLGFLLIQSTAVEFISAQSPHSMKGLLVGVFFAIKGLFQFISAAAVVPFAIPNFWNHITSVTNCGFGYYLFTIVVALIGLIVLFMVVKSYKYRQRDERPFDTRFAEQYYERYIGTSYTSVTGLGSPRNSCLHTSTHSARSYCNSSINSDYGATGDYDEMNICLADHVSQSYIGDINPQT